MSTMITLTILFLFFSSSSSSSTTFQHHHRRLLHQPLFPSISLPPTSSPQSQPQPQPPQQQPKLPFSSSSSSSSSPLNTFFPIFQSPPLPPSPTILATFPANISSLLLPQHHPLTHNHRSTAVVITSLSLFLLTFLTLSAVFAFHRHRQNNISSSTTVNDDNASRSDSLRLFPPNTATSDSVDLKPSQKPTSGSEISSDDTRVSVSGTGSSFNDDNSLPPPCRQLTDSPEIFPLPPLPRQNVTTTRTSEQNKEEEDEEFYQPLNLSPIKSVKSFPLQNPASPSFSPSSSMPKEDLSLDCWDGKDSQVTHLPPPAPPPLPPRVSESVDVRIENEETRKPKLKALHWDKVMASSDRVMVWDQMRPSSFQLNEEMIESLFLVNSNSNGNFALAPKENGWNQTIHSSSVPPENRVLDPKKSQNIAILLRAQNVTVGEVCEALREGNCDDTLGAEFLESLLKMTPTKEEESKLKEFKDESPLKLGPAEKFLKIMLDIPFAFKRVDAMLYIANFDSELEYLNKSFDTLEVACEELKSSKMLMKILEAVLRTGNRMNVGTDRGDAQAFKLDTLLKLVDIKGTDGKTTLLHFVVQEILRTESFGSHVPGADHHVDSFNDHQCTLDSTKLGLQVISALSGELTNVKKAAFMDSDALRSDVAKLAKGIEKVVKVIKLNQESPSKETNRIFSESMKGFLERGEEQILTIQAHEKNAISSVKEVTEYFHGNSTKEEAHPFRIFMVVRDFLSILDGVCKQVGKANERTLVGSRQYVVPAITTLPPIFPELITGKKPSDSSESD